MTDKKIFIFFDSHIEDDINNLTFLLKNLDLNKYKIDLMIEDTIKMKISKKINIIKFKASKNVIESFFLKIKFNLKTKYDSSILYTSNSILGNYFIRKSSKNRIIIVDLKDKEFTNIDEYRKYFIDRNIYEFNHIIFKNYQEQEKFIRFYPTLSKKTDVINDLINYELIEKLSNEEISEKIKRTDINILLIEELNEEKNKTLEKLQLINDLKKDVSNIKLFIIGDGIDRYAYKTFIEDNNLEDTIYLLGNKKNVYPYIKKCKYIFLNNFKTLEKYIMSCLVLKTIIISNYRYRDDKIDLEKNYGYIISDNKKVRKEEILTILKENKGKKMKLDFEKNNKSKIEQIENLMGEE